MGSWAADALAVVTITNPESPSRPGSISAGMQLRQRRKRLYLTQREAAGLAGCSLASIANLEAGYIPNRSRVLADVEAMLKRLEDDGQPGRGRP